MRVVFYCGNAKETHILLLDSILREIEEKLQQLPAFDKLTPVLALVLL